MASTANYVSTPLNTASVISATAYGGTRTSPTGLTTIYTGSTSADHRIFRIDVKSLGTSVAAILEFWRYDGTTYHLLPWGQSVTAITGSTTLDTWQTTLTFPDGTGQFYLPATAGTALTIAAGFSVTQTTAAVCTVQAGRL